VTFAATQHRISLAAHGTGLHVRCTDSSNGASVVVVRYRGDTLDAVEVYRGCHESWSDAEAAFEVFMDSMTIHKPCSPLLVGLTDPAEVMRVLIDHPILLYSEHSLFMRPFMAQGFLSYGDGHYSITENGRSIANPCDPMECRWCGLEHQGGPENCAVADEQDDEGITALFL